MSSMGVEGWILDVEPSSRGIDILLVNIHGDLHRLHMNTLFHGYIMPGRQVDPDYLLEDIACLNDVVDAWIEEWLKPPYYKDTVPIIVFSTYSLGTVHQIQTITWRKGVGYIVNDYPHPLVETLWRYGLKPSTRIRISSSRGVILEDNEVDYSPPPFTTIEIRLLRGSRRIYSVNEEPNGIEIIVDNRLAYRGSLGKGIDFLEDLRGHIGLAGIVEKKYIDTLYPSLLDNIVPVWINKDTMFTGVHGLIEWSRLSYTPIKYLSDKSIGGVLTTIEALEARRHKYLIVRGYGRIEPWRSIRDLAQDDRGGTVYTPRSGMYWRVCQIDFSSLYPSIIARYNISGETVDNPYCRDYTVPPGSSHRVCIERRGLVAGVMEWLISRREALRELVNSGEHRCPRKILVERIEAIKWILVASFGYLGYRNSLFGSIMAHETVTAVDRYITAVARRAVEDLGYRVIHILVDSLFIDNYGDPINCKYINNAIMEATGFKSRVEAEYLWLIIPSTRRGYGYSNRYFGKLVDGSLKIKGLYCVRSDTPQLIREAQLEALETLARIDEPVHVKEVLRDLERIYRKYHMLISSGRASVEKLVIVKNIRNPNTRYRDPRIKALDQLSLKTSRIAYVVAPHRKYVPIENGPSKYDRRYYLQLLDKAFREIVQPITLWNRS